MIIFPPFISKAPVSAFTEARVALEMSCMFILFEHPGHFFPPLTTQLTSDEKKHSFFLMFTVLYQLKVT